MTLFFMYLNDLHILLWILKYEKISKYSLDLDLHLDISFRILFCIDLDDYFVMDK